MPWIPSVNKDDVSFQSDWFGYSAVLVNDLPRELNTSTSGDGDVSIGDTNGTVVTAGTTEDDEASIWGPLDYVLDNLHYRRFSAIFRVDEFPTTDTVVIGQGRLDKESRGNYLDCDDGVVRTRDDSYSVNVSSGNYTAIDIIQIAGEGTEVRVTEDGGGIQTFEDDSRENDWRKERVLCRSNGKGNEVSVLAMRESWGVLE